MNIKKLWQKIRVPALSIGLALAVGGLSSLLTMKGMERFKAFEQPPLAPPDWVFPIVWSILFILMGISAAIIWRAPKSPERTRALTVYAIQLALNFGWTILFFGLHLFLAAFVWLIALEIMIALMIFAFYPISKTAALLQIPYFLWVAFAGYLNFMIWLLN